MSKVGVFYWSGTGNTEMMANAVADGAREAGAEVEIAEMSSVDPASVANYDGVAMGCPAMGAEELESDVVAPFSEAAAGLLSGKKVALFGSYGWGDGEWMRSWEDNLAGYGVSVACESVIAANTPDDDALAQCAELGKAIA